MKIGIRYEREMGKRVRERKESWGGREREIDREREREKKKRKKKKKHTQPYYLIHYD